jgi:hypothetical protein
MNSVSLGLCSRFPSTAASDNSNAEVGAIHTKAMPVILTTQDEIETWLTAPTPEALRLQRPIADVNGNQGRFTLLRLLWLQILC